MIGIAIDRQNKAHLVDYTHINGNKYTVCGKTYRVGEIVNDFQLDGAVPGVCRTCYDLYEEMYIDDLNDDLRKARGALFEKRFKRYAEIQRRHMGTKAQYWFLAFRGWSKLDTYKHLTTRYPNSRKYGIGRKHK